MSSKDPKRWAGGPPPPAAAFHVERVVDPFELNKVVGMVRHPQHPFVVDPEAYRGKDGATAWHRVGCAYLDALQQALGSQLDPGEWIHPEVRTALDRPAGPARGGFGWLPLTWPGPVTASPLPDGIGPLGTFRVQRHAASPDEVLQPSQLVLLAGNLLATNRLQLGSDIGLRIVVHEHEGQLRIHGVTLSGLAGRRAFEAVPDAKVSGGNLFALAELLKPAIASALRGEPQVWITNLESSRDRDAPQGRLTASGFALRDRRGSADNPYSAQSAQQWLSPRKLKRARAYDFCVDLDLDAQAGVRVARVHRDQYVGSGAADSSRWVTLQSFLADPASQPRAPGDGGIAKRRPSRPDAALAALRQPVQVNLPSSGALLYSEDDPLFAGGAARLSRRTAPELRTLEQTGGVVKLPAAFVRHAIDHPEAAGDAIVRSDQQAAIDAHLRGCELFDRLCAYGFEPHGYFRFARLPLLQRVRPAMRWAPDGELPNAEVRPFLDDTDSGLDSPQSVLLHRLQLLVMYGSADPMHRQVQKIAGGKRRKAQYLSVASDPRWAWHEFAHVLNFASTGELELPFAHSTGDALAAIAADPLSTLAEGDPDSPQRHVTFPWIEVPGRSHGRSARLGYGWCCRRNQVRLDFQSTLERYQHSYFGEQLMSSSLFRLYRCLGGDTRSSDDPQAEADRLRRLEASDYCIYLVMLAISLLGPDSVAPARTADQFVSALIEADLGTGLWQVEAGWPFTEDPRTMQRQGGRLHKVIRWAFEQQGLYATDDPFVVAEGVGLPPPVDLFIGDRRQPAADGGYHPVPLRTGDNEPWHAHPEWLGRNPAGLWVRVGQRGPQPATGARVRAWWRPASGDDQPPSAWHPIPEKPLPQAPTFGQPVRLDIDVAALPQGPLWVLMAVDADEDAANLPPERDWQALSMDELLPLVAHDNNLALARLT